MLQNPAPWSVVAPAVVLLLAGCAAPEYPPSAAALRQPGVFVALASVPSPSLRGLAPVDAELAWVGGLGGVWRTHDGGRSWQDVTPPGGHERDFRDVAAFGVDTALAMIAGTPAELWRTDDGGRTWTRVLHDERAGAFFDAMAFAGPHGALFADPLDGAFGLWTTADGGRTWTPVPRQSLPTPLPGEAAFAASGGCLHVGVLDGGPVVRVVTGGGARTRLLVGTPDGRWQAHDVPLAAGSSARGGFAVVPVGDARWCTVGGDYSDPRRSDGTAAVSDDGATWAPVAGGAGGYRSAVVALDAQCLLASGSHGSSWSEDGGRHWRLLDGGAFHALAIGGDGSVWACGAGGRVARFRPSAAGEVATRNRQTNGPSSGNGTNAR